MQSITEAADEAPTVEDALRAALSRICAHTGWQAGRLQFCPDAGDLAHRTFWHLMDPERLASYRALAQARRESPDLSLMPRVLAHGSPLWTPVPPGMENGHAATVAFPVFVGTSLLAMLEFFSDLEGRPDQATLDAVSLACAELGRILHRKPADEELRRSEREYRALFENARDAILIIDPRDEVVVDANRHACELYGFPRAELAGASAERLWRQPALDRARLREAEQGAGGEYESRHSRKDGSEIVVDVMPGPVEYRGRRALWTSIRDVSDRIRVLDALRTSEERYRLLFDASPQAMWVFDAETLRFLAVNDAAVKRYGYSRDEFLRMTILDIRPADDVPALHERLERLGDGGAASANIWRHRKANGELMDVEITSHAIELSGRRARLVVSIDVTERLRAEEKLWHAAFYDALTGLPNRALFMERLGMALERAKGRGRGGFAVLFLDLDRFKVVNDSLGHRAGDQLLIQISRRLERTRRAGDTVARLGGDEFAVLVEGVENASDAARVADRVQRELSMPFDIEGQEVFTSASIGIALGGAPHSLRPEDMLRDADTAMYRAKGMGIAKHAVFDVTMHDRAVAVLQLENDLRRAIERGELRVQYQPIVALGSGRIVGFEALARWQHRQRGTVAPSEFIPLAEETGVIGSLGRWVLQEACTQMTRLQANLPREKALTLSVNISGRQVLQPDLVEQIDDTLRATGLDARALRLEITESVLVENAAAATRCLMRLRQLGLQLCIDDFGTGYSSLSYLHRLPIDLLKIDSSFVRTMGSDEKNRRIVETILLLGRNLGVEVVAEGVETAAQASALHRLGCGLVQGFLFSHPLDIEAAAALVSGDASGIRAAALVQ
ncbi:MAG TPA: EAL domain-containing protein [Myxococcales bacterium]|nr:EAL domain-containing protein [Myxococcales bacterium]